MADSITIKTRKKIAERAGNRCEYCLCPANYSSTSFSVEHIIPIILNGNDDEDNLAYACQGCNNIKFVKTSGIDPETNQAAPLYNPRQHSWAAHFCWDDTLTQIMGISSIGRATVATLRLNREEICNLRSVLFLIGEHPPPSL
jgi:hypothetical protein